MKFAEKQGVSDENEREWLTKITQQQDKKAMQAIYQLYQTKLASFLFRIINSQSLVEEVFNDTMMIVWQKSGQFNGESKVSTWIFSIAYRQCLKRIEKEKKHQAETLDSDIDAVSHDNKQEITDLIRKALSQLSTEHRSVIELSYYLGCDYAEIATIMNCPENTIKTRMFYARKRLKETLTSMGEASTTA